MATSVVLFPLGCKTGQVGIDHGKNKALKRTKNRSLHWNDSRYGGEFLMLLSITLSLLIATLLSLCCTRFFWSVNHELSFITNTGLSREVLEMLEYEHGAFHWYAADFNDAEDRNLAVAVLKAYKDGGNINEAATDILPAAFEICEPHCEIIEDVNLHVDEDGVYYAHFSECGVCDQLFDMEDIEEDDREPESSKEDFFDALFGHRGGV